MRFANINFLFGQPIRRFSSKQKLRDYVFPEILPEHCEKKLISGWGPGGSRVNAQRNAVILKHIPSGLVVKVHDTRMPFENEKIAFERLKYKLDRKINGENCYEEQFKKLEKERQDNLKRKKASARKRKLKVSQ
ncbi:unnamed protein product [Dracunculus medinensis]|uniref:RF_PROK_I domain-containing protein n=1 Tax=Dracunculus medinensis TaxID=318479 RepID=A0A0N4U3G3_DRAME|nr:unnamed protein product [Dracunculus medinensis]